MEPPTRRILQCNDEGWEYVETVSACHETYGDGAELTTMNRCLPQSPLGPPDDGQATQQLEARLESIEHELAEQKRLANETLWAQVFGSTIASSSWLRDPSFSPGRWAVGYPYLYVMYRILNEIRPMRILELGMGQSTRMISQYAREFPGVEHIVVEHDDKWIEFFSRGFKLADCTRVLQLDWDYVPFNGAEGVRVYGGFVEALAGSQFDFISIDGPLGGDMETYARIDVLQLLPECVSSSFAIMIDDCERSGELNTMYEMQQSLSRCDVPYESCKYSGMKDLGLLCSSDLAFLCSL